MDPLWSVLAHRLSRHPQRYREILRVVRKYQLHHIVFDLGIVPVQDDDGGEPTRHVAAGENGNAVRFASALEELGPCFIKLGQLLSTRPDLLPPAYIQALSRLQNQVTPLPAQQIMALIEQELGMPIDSAFRSFDQTPLATGSMAQVHRATLKDGADVAVKVLRPGVRRKTEVDIDVLHEVARFVKRYPAVNEFVNLEQVVSELEHSLRSDMDFRQEIENTQRIGRQLADFDLLTVPFVSVEHSAGRVITLGYVPGRNLSKCSREQLKAINAPGIAEQLLSAYLKQIVVEGCFHCDPHPGNILITDTGQLALLDFGMVGRFDAEEKDTIIQLLLAFSERQGRRVADTYLSMVDVPKRVNRRAFVHDVETFVSRYHDMSGGRMGLGTAFLELARVAEDHRVPVPSAWTLLSKTILNLDGILSALSPELDPVQLIRQYMMQVMETRMLAESSSGKMFAWGLDFLTLLKNGPRHADTLLTKLANDQLTIQFDVEPSEETRKEIHTAVSRLSFGMVTAAIIVAGGYVLGSLVRTDRPRRGAVGDERLKAR